MTPAKLLALMEKDMERLELSEYPIARLGWLYVNAHRDPGDAERGRPPAEPVPFEECLVFAKRRKGKGLVTKDTPQPGGAHNYRGAKADRAAFEAMGRANRRRLTVKKGSK